MFFIWPFKINFVSLLYEKVNSYPYSFSVGYSSFNEERKF